ncbi:MAG: DUF4363 family protein [Dethiobacter sp.]|jgi:hypothetical protein|nr:DUF4363 family protein [Dethiobacter sp.]
MRTLLIAIGLLIVVIAGSAAFFIYTTVLYHNLQDGLVRLQQQVEQEEWAKAEVEAERLKKLWRRADDAWMPIMDHRQVDRTDESFTQVFRLVELKNKESLLLEISAVRRLLYRLMETERPNLRNIF